MWQRCVHRSKTAPVSRAFPMTSVHCSNGRFVGTRTLVLSYPARSHRRVTRSLRLILGQIPFDKRKKRADGRLAAGTAAVTARLRVSGYLLNGTNTQAETLARLEMFSTKRAWRMVCQWYMSQYMGYDQKEIGKKNQENAPGKCNQNPTNLGYNRAAVFYCYTQTSSIATRIRDKSGKFFAIGGKKGLSHQNTT